MLSEPTAVEPAVAAGAMAATMVVLERVAFAVGVVGMAVLLWGVARGAWGFLRLELRRGSWRSGHGERTELRGMIGYYLLLGLEFLVAADIVETILTPSLEHVLILGGVVLIRTVISFSLTWELEREARGSGEQPAEHPGA